MEHSLSSETSTLSLVDNTGHASTAHADQRTLHDIAARLPAVLQTSLELESVITLFHQEISQVLRYDSLHYEHQGVDVSFGRAKHHRCHYRLEMNGQWLGEITLTRRNRFSDQDTQHVEDLLCKLVYPVRNCLLFRQAQAAALQDTLTGLYNRGAFDEHLKREIHLAQRQNSPLSLIVLDIDHFKVVNDTYGHSSGDQALKLLAQTIRSSLRESDVAFRYGGEEFTLILSNTDYHAAKRVAERLRIAVAQSSCHHEAQTFGFTISAGVAELKRMEQGSQLFDRADHALYFAKQSGRNQTICAEEISTDTH